MLIDLIIVRLSFIVRLLIVHEWNTVKLMYDCLRALLRGHWSEAVELIMKPRDGGLYAV